MSGFLRVHVLCIVISVEHAKLTQKKVWECGKMCLKCNCMLIQEDKLRNWVPHHPWLYFLGKCFTDSIDCTNNEHYMHWTRFRHHYNWAFSVAPVVFLDTLFLQQRDIMNRETERHHLIMKSVHRSVMFSFSVRKTMRYWLQYNQRP